MNTQYTFCVYSASAHCLNWKPSHETRIQSASRVSRLAGVLTFALVRWVASQGVAIVTLFAAIAEKAVRVVDALEALAAIAVTVAHGVGVNVIVAIARPARPRLTVHALWVAEKPVVAQLATFPWVQTRGTISIYRNDH